MLNKILGHYLHPKHFWIVRLCIGAVVCALCFVLGYWLESHALELGGEFAACAIVDRLLFIGESV